ncbi:MAG: CRISPR-associated endonuclease Cas3'' [Burkholderiales bacterium]|nr:CRISPR-associated endonuclease Cas3'' [Burkholderiales bacterium]
MPSDFDADPPWAHAPAPGSNRPPHRLDDHLRAVGERAAQLAPPAMRELARLAGLWHDLGKRRPGFQRYIRAAGGVDAHIEGRVPDRDKTHSAAGALWAAEHLSERFGREGTLVSRLLQYAIAGHHAGLADWGGDLAARLAGADARRECDEALAAPGPDALLRPCAADGLDPRVVLKLLNDSQPSQPGRAALWLRMLFSALVDADFLDTEAYFDPQKAGQRAGVASLEPLKRALDEHLERLGAAAAGRVNAARAAVLRQCRDKAMRPPGVFRLTVPTGGGKTLASLAFALDHALTQGKRRVIYAIPYTSIIEQTADVFRRVLTALGDDLVVEHHGNADGDEARENHRSRLACENWDAPLIVTTNVQLFESLFARTTSRCRKLHNLQHSVIVLDEAQLLPLAFLQPIVDVLHYLVQDFGVTVLLCTATQPVLDTQPNAADPARGLQRGLGSVTEIIDDVPALYAALQRVRVHLPPNFHDAKPWSEVADELAGHEVVLAIVNRRADAAELHRLVRARAEAAAHESCWHLSALMCAQHRSDTIAAIKAALEERRRALAQGQPAAAVRVVSTQLVEAGVDLDFPVVYRALAGADAIAQAAGRCNREGRLPQPGQVHVFVPPTASPPGLLRLARDTCKAVWHDLPADPLAIEHVRRYFERMLHDAPSTDARRICELLHCRADLHELSVPLALRSAAEAFRLIDDEDTATVLVRYRSPHGGPDIDALIGLLQREGPTRWLMRRLQRFGVSIYRRDAETLLGRGDIEEIGTCPGLYVQREHWHDLYDPVLGLRVAAAPGDPLLA